VEEQHLQNSNFVTFAVLELIPTPQQQIVTQIVQHVSQENIIVNKAVLRRHIV
jgi:hypothetical protein